MASESRYPTGDTGTGADFTDIGTWRLRTAQDLVVAVVEADTEITAEAAVREGSMVQTPTPPPHQDGQKTRGGGQNGRKGGRLA